MLSVGKKKKKKKKVIIIIKNDIKSDRFTKNFPFQDIYLSSKKLLKFCHFVSPRASTPRSDAFFKKQETIL